MTGARVTVAVLLALAAPAGCSSDDGSGADEPSVTTTGTTPSTTTGTTPGTTPGTTEITTQGTTTDPSPVTTPPPTGDEPSIPVTPTGFDRVQATVTTADGEVCELCLWLASTAGERRQGLMGVTDLGAGDGMAFVYDGPHTGSFWMKNTVLPLSIAFFDPDGAYLDAFDMEPCIADPCPLYPTASDFLVAIETEQGGLADLGIADGSLLTLTDVPCAE